MTRRMLRGRPGVWQLCVLAALAVPGLLQAQNSVYGVQGIGFPGRPIGVRSRSLGGGNAAFDPTSALNPATVGGYPRVAASVGIGTTLRSYTAGDSAVSGLQETRFPFGMVGSPLGASPLALALSFAPYAERSFDLRTAGSITLRGESIAVADQVSSDGGVSDLRAALALRLGRPLMVGAAAHVLSGSSTLRVRREFSSSLYQPYTEQSQLVFSGLGMSFGAMVRVSSGLQLGAAARLDGTLETSRDTTVLQTVDLPATLSGGLRVVPARGLTWTTTVTWRSWSDAAVDLAPATRAWDTWQVGSGVEVGGLEAGTTRMPIRLGIHYAQLPFSSRGTQGQEFTLAAGTGMPFADGRIAFDLAVERALRYGAGAREVAWHVAIGVFVMP